LFRNELVRDAEFETAFPEYTHVVESVRKICLRWNTDKIIRRLVKHASPGCKLRFQAVRLVKQPPRQARNVRRIGHYLESIAVFTAEEQRTFDAYDCGKQRALAMRASGLNARELLFYVGAERHLLEHLREHLAQLDRIMPSRLIVIDKVALENTRAMLFDCSRFLVVNNEKPFEAPVVFLWDY